jgi:N-acyl amino acid synthase of PEP-CTERM/exosortase system
MEFTLLGTPNGDRSPSERFLSASRFKKADSEDELREIYKLRYKVYCEEKGFEKAEDHPGGIESDEFDKSSRHFMVTDRSRRAIATARLILDSGMGLPIMANCRIEKDLSRLNSSQVGEISRLAVSKEYLKMDELFSDGLSDRRRRQMVICGLYKLIYIESRALGLTHWLAVMTDGLRQLLAKSGIFFSPIGPSTDYHGVRTPCLGSIAEIESRVSRVNPELFREVATHTRLLL